MAWFSHKYIMHGFLWSLHKDHHIKTPGLLERNDLFFLLFAAPGVLLLAIGIHTMYPYAISAGVGISLYGLVYFVVHDILIHRRWSNIKLPNSSYFKAIRAAHSAHHRHTTPDNGECFGLLWAPKRFYRGGQPHK